MATQSPPPSRPSVPRAASPDFSAGSSSARRAPRQRQRLRRAARAAGWLLVAVVALVLAGAAALWWWAGSNTSLAAALARAAQYLPAEQQLESRDVTGSLRSGGQIGWLRWSSPALTVEATDIRLGWQLVPLLQRRLELGQIHAARILITPQPTEPPQPSAPAVPIEQLVLPLQVSVPFRVDEIQWAGAPAVQVLDLEGDYHFDGAEHRLNIGQVALAQGRYNARATLQARSPMALSAQVNGTLETAVPGSTRTAPLQVGAQATLQGTLATAAARLQLQARIRPLTGEASMAPPTAPATAASASASAQQTPAPATEAMQAEVLATLSPWAPQPLQSATATLRALDLAALWPRAPLTRLHGTVQAGPTPAPGGWALQADLRNDLPGPWDRSRLPLAALQGSATYDGTRWDVPAATASAGSGSAALQGRYTPATGALEGRADLRGIRPDALHSAMAAAPLSGRLQAQSRSQSEGDGVRFSADLRTSGSERGARAAGATAPLRINTFTARGLWQPAAASPAGTSTGTGAMLTIDRLLLDAMQARVEATQLRIALGARSAQGQVAVTVPGATLRASGQAAPHAGTGELQLQASDADRAMRWITTLPWVGPRAQEALRGSSAKGAVQLRARWKGGWQAAADQLQAAAAGSALPRTHPLFELQAQLSASQLDLSLPAESRAAAPAAAPAPTSTPASARASGTAVAPPQAIALRGVSAELSGTLAQAALTLNGEARTASPEPLRTTVQARVSGGVAGAGRWQLQVSSLGLQVQPGQRPGPWLLQLSQPMSIATARAASSTTVQVSAGQARLSGPAPGEVTLRWSPARVALTPAGTAVQTEGTLQGLPTAWVDALGLGAGAKPAPAGVAAQPLLARMGLATTLVLDGQWKVDTTQPGTPRASASLRRAGGDLRILAGDPTAVTAVQSSGQGTGAGATTAIATEATQNAQKAASTAPSVPEAGTPAGVRQAELSVALEGDALRARLQWASERAGEIDATASTRLALPTATAPFGWPANAPLAGTLRARLPDVGVWSALAPPGWRVRGTLNASAALSGTRDAPRWSGTLGADDMAVRSVVDGVDLQDGRLRATLEGNQLNITEFSLQGGRGSSARIAGFSGNRTAAPRDGGTLTATGRIRWGDAGAASASGLSGITMALQAEARALQVLVRADRQLSVSGTLQAQLQQGQISLRGKLTADRATIILPDESAPSLGSDVVVRSAAKDREAQAKAQQAAKASQNAAQVEAAKPPDIAITLNLGRDFALHGHGITTRLTGELEIRSNAVPGAPPRVFGEVRTDAGRYRAWGQMLDVETGLIRFNGPYDNPSLDILALRPNISVRAGVQVSGSAQAPRVKLYSDPDLPDAEKLSWVVLGRNAASGGAEAAVLQQAALALLGRGGTNPGGGFAKRIGLDEIGFRGATPGDDASSAALTFGKRLSQDLYVTYERSLSGTLGTLYIFYDLTRRLTLRGQTGEKSAVDLIYTLKYD
ncbi:translocation/assembly module TamB domain-containing protein [Paracidovorax sp. MALMAid1276]|uniref:translocation/assembly module TamB domain-containing protein n=1 Tax=Paracidovorax sp. MALMAid1276 TaxID=3411631 RepID=UPI003B9B2CB4